ncbi:MAG: sensor histidine kinase [Thermodesulfobacteriota bacterium]
MKKIEIDIELELSDKELSQIELHSFHNVMTIIFGEIQFIGKVLGDKTVLKDSLSLCNELLESIYDIKKAEVLIRNWADHQTGILAQIDQAMSSHQLTPQHEKLIEDSTANLKRILGIIDVRVKELLARFHIPGEWRLFSIKEVVFRLRQVLDAIAQNSRGHYGIVYDPDQQTKKDYLVNIIVAGRQGDNITIPPVLLDTFRDLTANARKYTEPGGMIESSLMEKEDGVSLAVSDNGRGIPENEIQNVVRFGIRGSNTKPTETKGGGYGLTKAFWVCRQHQGRMWIESELGAGTTVSLYIPRPVLSKAT